ncbi:ATP synthase F0 subcomplex B subunit [Psychromonas ingrahamii 37]|uniref:ATP synthase subunit b n=1 Tax=Psychromonas ingrahamii (strain DSM 17664 / CCUG 51855 / 37) TaxID=357804 RepID=ATPF_PSYIN|nr:F0F1 ATP synthase subunit B [Psychromonas ingrahamii]A1T0Z3.1 RecName: Full=ATP synthase subunit b; AltName: Full=ATP synthase F(0) sector subunit b; AltName: Full=ATPase subunit I; AltName: Full=F-type ATPase subunit b; Short=F-ATPase subunit b [Psychromonas ingrahamii 37]ABM05408.1 ATP synthase F0 subcomplex B subunit [Psychromonas ingrahamii 37]
MNINATLLGQAIAFAVFVWFCMKYVWPPLLAAIEDRQKKISDGLTQAERAGKDLELAQAKASEKLKEAKVQAAEIIEQANKRRNQIVEAAKTEAETERQKIIAQGEAEVEVDRNRVREELRLKVSALAIAGAEKIIKRSIDKEANSDIIDKLVAEL